MNDAQAIRTDEILAVLMAMFEGPMREGLRYKVEEGQESVVLRLGYAGEDSPARPVLAYEIDFEGRFRRIYTKEQAREEAARSPKRYRKLKRNVYVEADGDWKHGPYKK